MSKRDKGRLPPFVPIFKGTLASPAWRAMSHGARNLYVSLKSRHNSKLDNNGRVYLSQRTAVRELGSGFSEITRWFRELQHYGFIVMTEPGCLGVEGKGKAPHWRLTECGCMNDPPTRDFDKWKGRAFKNERRKKQNPAPENRSTLLQKTGAPPLQKTVAPTGTSAPESYSIYAPSPAPENRSVSSIPLPSPEEGEPLQPALSEAVASQWQDLEIPAFLRRH